MPPSDRSAVQAARTRRRPWPGIVRPASLWRAAVALALLVAMLLPWPGLGRAYVRAFGSVATVAAGPLLGGSGLRVSLGTFPEGDAHHEWYVRVLASDAVTGAPRTMGAADLRRSGYLQIAIFVAVAAAFPPRRRRWYGAAIATGTAGLATLGWLPVLMYLAVKHVLGLGRASYAVLAVVDRSLIAAPGMAFAAPVLLWLLARWLLDRPEVQASGNMSLDPAPTPRP